jgi:hypothetical protein
MLGFVLETDLGIVPVFELILKTDQKRFGLIRRAFPKDEKNNFLLSLINFLTSVLSKHPVEMTKYLEENR